MTKYLDLQAETRKPTHTEPRPYVPGEASDADREWIARNRGLRPHSIQIYQPISVGKTFSGLIDLANEKSVTVEIDWQSRIVWVINRPPGAQVQYVGALPFENVKAVLYGGLVRAPEAAQ